MFFFIFFISADVIHRSSFLAGVHVLLNLAICSEIIGRSWRGWKSRNPWWTWKTGKLMCHSYPRLHLVLLYLYFPLTLTSHSSGSQWSKRLTRGACELAVSKRNMARYRKGCCYGRNVLMSIVIKGKTWWSWSSWCARRVWCWRI